MTIYYVNLALIGIYAGICKLISGEQKNQTLYRLFFCLSSLQLILIAALRKASFSSDFVSYIDYYNQLPLQNWSEVLAHRYEDGFSILMKILSLFALSPQWLMAVMETLSLLPILVMIYKYSPMPFLSLAMYVCLPFYTFTFVGARQVLGWALTFWSFHFIVKRKIIPFALLVTLAAFMHKSAIVFFPAYFLCRLKINRYTWVWFAGLLLAIYAARIPIVNFFTTHIYDNYSVSIRYFSNMIVVTLLIAFVSLFLYARLDPSVRDRADWNGMCVLVLLSACLVLFNTVTTNGSRIVNYFFLYIILFFPNLLYAYRQDRFYPLLVFLTAVMMPITLFLILGGNDTMNLGHYRFFWQ